MALSPPHISVCICTYRRPRLLARLLDAVKTQVTRGLFTCSVVVVDNDSMASARAQVEAVQAQSPIAIVYCVEPRQNIAMARNTAVAAAAGDFIAFIDDDEFPPDDWLLTMFQLIEQTGVSGVLAPVNPHFPPEAPRWVVKGGFYDRPSHPTGMELRWPQCRTGNVLMRRSLFAPLVQPFNPECLSGEDQDFFRRMIDAGHRFIWCHEGAVLEEVPPARWKRAYLIRRAMFRGVFAQRNHGLQPVRLLQAIVSIPLFLLILPLALVAGQASFMLCVFKIAYHAGRLFALAGHNPIGQVYVTE